MNAAIAGVVAAGSPDFVNGLDTVFGAADRLAAADRRAGLAVPRRLALAPGFFTALRADLTDLTVFFLLGAVALEVPPADLLLALLIIFSIAANSV
jgi:hypothetical protein